MQQLPYAVAIIAVAAFGWDVARRFLERWSRQLEVVNQFQALRRDFDLLDVKTKKTVGDLADTTHERILEIKAQVGFQEARQNLASSRRIG